MTGTQLIGVMLVCAACVLFLNRHTLAWHVAILIARVSRARRKARRGRGIYRRMAGDGTYGRPWGGA